MRDDGATLTSYTPSSTPSLIDVSDEWSNHETSHVSGCVEKTDSQTVWIAEILIPVVESLETGDQITIVYSSSDRSYGPSTSVTYSR